MTELPISGAAIANTLALLPLCDPLLVRIYSRGALNTRRPHATSDPGMQYFALHLPVVVTGMVRVRNLITSHPCCAAASVRDRAAYAMPGGAISTTGQNANLARCWAPHDPFGMAFLVSDTFSA